MSHDHSEAVIGPSTNERVTNPCLKSVAAETPTKKETPETVVKLLYDSLKPEQRKEVCFGWDHVDSKRGLLRSHISNNWHITKPTINSEFFTAEQRKIVREVWEGIVNPGGP